MPKLKFFSDFRDSKRFLTFFFKSYRYNRDRDLSEEAINATATNVSGNSSDSDNVGRYMNMVFLADLATRTDSQSTMADTRAKPPLRLEMDRYLSMPTDPTIPVEQVEKEMLKWWAAKKGELPLLAELAREYLCIPASSSPSERLFSHAGNIVTDTRHSLDPENVSMLLFIKENLHRCMSSWKKWKTRVPEENSWYEENEPSEALPPSQPSEDSQSQSLINAPKKKKYDAEARKRYHEEHPNSTSPSLPRTPENTRKKMKSQPKIPKNQQKLTDMLKKKKERLNFISDSDSEPEPQPEEQKSPQKRKHSDVGASTSSQQQPPPEKKKKKSKKLSVEKVSELLTQDMDIFDKSTDNDDFDE